LRNDVTNTVCEISSSLGGLQPFHRKSTCSAQLTLGHCVVHIWSLSPQNRGERNARSPPCGDRGWDPTASLSGQLRPTSSTSPQSRDTTPCRMTELTLYSHVRYKENRGPQHVRAYDCVSRPGYLTRAVSPDSERDQITVFQSP